MDAGTISISIGDGRHGSSIVLPRGHELVRHLEALLPATVNSAPKLAPPPPQYMYRQDAETTDALNALAAMSQRASLPVLPSLTRHLHNQSPTPVAYRPSSPYLSDSSCSSSSTPQNSASSEESSTTTGGVKRRRAGKACASSGKKCQIPDCDKISVSRGLCRGHGGGRRCQFEGCTKGAQSRSDFCWSHGGGQRCEVPNCMRSRKTKRFCVAHLNWENATEGAALPTGEMTPRVLDAQQKVLMPRVIAPAVPEYVQTPASKLPSLQQALQKHQCAVPIVSTGFTHYAPLSC